MNRITKLFSMLALAVIVAVGCSKDDGVGAYGISGTPVITSLEAGYMRVEVTWEHNTTSDDATTTNIYWANGTKDAGRLMSAVDGSTVTLSLTEENGLTEGEHTFYVQNKHATKGTSSAESTPVTITVYGADYCSELAARSISGIYDIEDEAQGDVGTYVKWGSAPSESIGCVLYFDDIFGVSNEVICKNTDAETYIGDNAIDESEVSSASMYMPEGCLDTLYSDKVVAEATVPLASDGIIRVASIEAMASLMSGSDQSVKMILDDDNEYNIYAYHISNGLYPYFAEVVEGTTTHSLFLVSGSNNTFDFNGANVIVSTDVFDTSGYEFHHLHFLGNNNTVKGLVMTDVGDAEKIHRNGVTNIVMDGSKNVLEEVVMTSTGSYPYRYGELFGKGGGPVIGHYKHCGVLVRGEYNTVLNCEIYHKAYGHALFMQAADYPTIQGTYIQGEMTTTEGVLSEKEYDPDSPANRVKFETTWGFEVFSGYTISLIEAGIRAYNSGNTMINGVRTTDMATNMPTVKDCFIVDTRSGVALAHATGTPYVSNTWTIGCDRGFAVGTGGTVEGCYSDAQYGPAFGVDYQSDNNIKADLTILPNVRPTSIEYNGTGRWYDSGNGSRQVVYSYGTDVQINLRAYDKSEVDASGFTRQAMIDMWNSLGNSLEETQEDFSNAVSKRYICVGGVNNTVGEIDTDENRYANKVNVYNETPYAVIVDSEAYNCTIESKGEIFAEPAGETQSSSPNSYKDMYGVEKDPVTNTSGVYWMTSMVQYDPSEINIINTNPEEDEDY